MSNELRKAELEAKREKLNKMRAERMKPGLTTPVSTTPSASSSTLTTDQVADIDPDEILKGIIPQLPPTSATIPSNTGQIQSNVSPSSLQQKRRGPTSIALQICQQSSATVSVAPKELVTYSKEVQTIESGEKDPAASPIQHSHLLWDDEFPPPSGEDRNQIVFLSDEDTMSIDEHPTKSSMGMSLSSVHELKRTRSLKQAHKQASLQGQQTIPKPEITNEEREQILRSDQFQDFFSRTSRLIERSLWETPRSFDIFKDYDPRDSDGKNEKMDVGEIIKFDRDFSDERWTRHRIITCLDTSTYHPELVLASYSQNEESTHESDGVVLIWNTKYKSKPTPEVKENLYTYLFIGSI